MDKVPAYILFLGALTSLVCFLIVEEDLIFIGLALLCGGLGWFLMSTTSSSKVNCTIRYEKWNVIYGNKEECIEFTFDETKTHLN